MRKMNIRFEIVAILVDVLIFTLSQCLPINNTTKFIMIGISLILAFTILLLAGYSVFSWFRERYIVNPSQDTQELEAKKQLGESLHQNLNLAQDQGQIHNEETVTNLILSQKNTNTPVLLIIACLLAIVIITLATLFGVLHFLQENTLGHEKDNPHSAPISTSENSVFPEKTSSVIPTVNQISSASSTTKLATSPSPEPTSSTPSPTSTPTSAPTSLMVTVPYVVGKTQSEAQTALRDSNLTSTVKTVFYYGNDYKIGTVISQDTASGRLVNPETLISLTVSGGSDSWKISETRPDSSIYEIKEITQYRSAEKKVLTAYGDQAPNTPDGFTLLNSAATGKYSEWSVESRYNPTPISKTDMRESVPETDYRFYFFECINGHRCPYCNVSCSECGLSIYENSFKDKFYWQSGNDLSSWKYDNSKRAVTLDGETWYYTTESGWNGWYYGQYTETYYTYQKREQEIAYTYRSNTWSDWTEKPYTKTDTVDVDTRIVYQYRTKEYIEKP